MSETDRQRRARWFQRALSEKGELHFPASGWAGWSDEDIEAKRTELRETIEDVAEHTPLHVDEREDGAVVVRPLAALN